MTESDRPTGGAGHASRARGATRNMPAEPILRLGLAAAPLLAYTHGGAKISAKRGPSSSAGRSENYPADVDTSVPYEAAIDPGPVWTGIPAPFPSLPPPPPAQPARPVRRIRRGAAWCEDHPDDLATAHPDDLAGLDY